MGHSSFMQTSFLGGLWSALAQGRMEAAGYKTGLNVCENYYPVEQGPLLRRQGTRYLAHTRRGNKAKLIPFDFSIVQPYQIEFTNLFARFYMGTSQVFTDPEFNILDISASTPAVVTTDGAHGWSTGDDVVFELSGPPCRATLLCNRQFTITKITADTFSIADALTQAAINGATVAWTPPPAGETDQVFRILELASPYTTAQVTDRLLHFVQDETTVTFLRNDTKPYTLAEGGTFFTLNAATFTDGPYLDENTTTTTLTPSGTSGSVTITASATTGINGGAGFLTTDVGRLIRLRSSPAAWSSVTTYSEGDLVTGSDGQIYTSLANTNTNHDPTKNVVKWAISLTNFVWNWATITARSSTTVVTAFLQQVDSDAGNLLNTTATTHWRLGLWSDTTGWPTCGGYHEGRFWFGGAAGNRFDASKSGAHYNFSPTAGDGTVADDNAIAATFTAQDVNQLLWFLPDDSGLWAGTQAGEWRVRASSLDDPIAPASIQVRRPTTFGNADEQALTTPNRVIFTQRQKRKLIEYDTTKNKPDGKNLNLTNEEISVGGIEEVVYQQEPTPMIWALVASGGVIGCSYKRDEEKAYAGWHEVFFGGERLAESLSVGYTADGLSNALYLVTKDPDDDTAPRFVEMLTPMFDSQTPDHKAWFVDTGIVPCCATLTGNLSVGNITFYGLHALEGESVCPFIAGVDVGPRTVTSGAVTVALGSDPDGVFTGNLLTTVNNEALDYGDYSVDILVGNVSNPGPTISAPSVLAYDGSSGPSGNVAGSDSTSVAVDWENGYVYTHNNGNTSTDGLRRFLLDVPATLSLDHSTSQIGVPADGVGVASGGGYEILPNGILTLINKSTNSAQLSSVTASTLLYDTSFGVSSGNASASSATRILAPLQFCPLVNNGTTYLLSASIALAGGGEICIMPVAAGVFGPNVRIGAISETGGQAYICQGYRTGAGGNAYGIGTAEWAGGAFPAPDPFGVYRIGVSSMTRVGGVAPTDVDATWTNFSDVRGIAFDQTDGNILTVVATTDAVVHQVYIIKVSTITAAVMWATPVNAMIAGLNENMQRSRIVNGTFFYIGSGGVVYAINTASGAVVTQTFGGVGSVTRNISDDVSNSVIGYGSAGGAGVTEIGDWMDTQGHSIVSNMWVRVFYGTVAGQNRGSALTVYTIGAPIGFCYTSRAQLLRPDFGQDAGAAAGPAFAKKRRLHWYGAYFSRTRNISIGTDFNHLRPIKFQSAGGIIINAPTLFSGIVSATLESDYHFEGQIAWEQTTAYPSIVLSMAGFIASQDK